MRLILASILLLISAGAQAADCSKWKASMEEGEGGSRMVARMCNAAGGELTIECGAPGVLMLAFAPSENFAPPGDNPDFVGPFSIKVGMESFDRDMTYWAMDGLMGAEVTFQDKLAEALGKADAGTISFASSKAGIAESRFPLSGATAALKKLKASCRKG
ncbi:MAG TPA: hypothetical protein VN112_01290 [Ensifer sp.]|nr:hypothetical protein [Ensifer sp.]